MEPTQPNAISTQGTNSDRKKEKCCGKFIFYKFIGNLSWEETRKYINKYHPKKLQINLQKTLYTL